jgi:hypothetical protein
MARFLVQTIPNKLPELPINLSSQGPHLMGATLSTLLRAVHPGTIAMTDFRQRLRPKVLTRHLGDLGILHVISCSDGHIVRIALKGFWGYWLTYRKLSELSDPIIESYDS